MGRLPEPESAVMPHPADPPAAPPVTSTPRFTGRSALITGAGRGIGRAFAVALAREGCRLVICDICEGLPEGTPYPRTSRADLTETQRICETLGAEVVWKVGDAGDPALARELVALAERHFGGLDFLIANAALTIEGEIVDLTPEIFETVVRNNLLGVFNILSPALRSMRQAGRGRVIVVASGDARHAEPNAAPYVASKWGLIGLAKVAALEVAKAGITVNAILPGPVDTPMMSSEQRFRQVVPDKENPTRDDYLEARRDATPMGYAWVKPEDIAAGALFLLSDEARFVSGGTLSIDAADSANWT
ncbi:MULTISPECIES: SDR family oxidoreductase [Sphingobium]|jgi:NAD(P)-dependent dehydrogenase (short-subunit alcohol dehydrogenase family)|uniref:3-oxoacyl-[acyl-carrier protein] reductase n=2 Tax=Sphingobium fuliginis (strain ATCC 27551) TaxID=336203 RepID=A0A292ZCT8_SPHSA|nr:MULTISPECIES: SDR family oxidoreductase [Sphingobium]QOT70240.1 SDR family oxidoreductase [Sphingobium fuliginis]GAY20766.1 3-oxoacyl-[acyl-carrier protein] reductase [Sphingobium fuliginis]